MGAQIIARKTFTADLVRDGSMIHQELGRHESTMELMQTGLHLMIEWDIPSLEETEHIGLDFEWNGTAWQLTDYDGVFALPKEAIELLRENGYVVTEDFE